MGTGTFPHLQDWASSEDNVSLSRGHGWVVSKECPWLSLCSVSVTGYNKRLSTSCGLWNAQASLSPCPNVKGLQWTHQALVPYVSSPRCKLLCSKAEQPWACYTAWLMALYSLWVQASSFHTLPQAVKSLFGRASISCSFYFTVIEVKLNCL